VPVTGYDVWRISSGQRLDPEQFLILFPQPPEKLESFRLTAGGMSYALALDKQGRFVPRSPCIFLMRLAGGHERCGIYDHRPSACRTYPMRMEGRQIVQRPDLLCPPNSWPPAAMARPSWREALQRQRMQYDIYHEVVTRWNTRVDARPATRFVAPEYYSYVLNVYARLAALDATVGPETLAAVEASWPHLGGPRADVAPLRAEIGPQPWIDYLEATRAIIDGFYPETPVQPLMSVKRET
jgi:Fe-S-cluster containining protein